MLINSEKGEKAWADICSRLKLCEPVPLDFALKHNRFRSKIRIPEGREKFFEENRKQTFKKAVEIAGGQKFSKKAAAKQWLKRVLPEEVVKAVKRMKK